MNAEHETYDSINEFGIAGEFGFLRFEGPFVTEKEGTKWTVVIGGDYEHPSLSVLDDQEGRAAALVADGEIVGGGVIDAVAHLDGAGKTHVVVDQYARG